ncbi:MAG: energy transducer TonB [Pyrinomonadaceae bacterium]|nr:energy transducer TonB [Sphingobacteriaceae bacterium]
MTFKNGKPLGDRYEYYANGKLRLRMTHLENANQPHGQASDFGKSKFSLWEYLDSAGVQFVKDGNGFYKTFDNDLPINEEGNYVNGFKDGAWKGFFNKTDASYEEIFDKGKFISGKAKWDDGSIHTYTKFEEQPDYPGGIKNFYEYVGRTYKFTPEAKKVGVRGSVVVTFVVEEDGSLTDFMILRDLGYGTGQEAIRVLRGSRNWIPGRQHGVPVRVSYTLPLALNIR